MKPFLSRFVRRGLLLLFLALSCQLEAAVLEYSLLGLDGPAEKNALAWLGDPPETPQARSNFLFTASDRIESSLQALGYYNATIALDVVREEPVWKLRIEVDPGEPVRITSAEVKVTGEALEDPAFAALLADLPLRPGNVLNHGEYEAFKRRLQSLGQQRGYFDGLISHSRVEVEPLSGTASIQLQYDSGQRYRFGPLVFDEQTIAGDLLEPLLAFQQGELYDQSLVQQSQASLQATGYFSAVILRPQLAGLEGQQVPMELDVFPAKSHSFNLGVGYSTDTQERLSFTWRTPKLNSRGHSQETRLQYSRINPSGRFTYSIPMSHPLNDVLQLSARMEDNEFGDLDSYQKELGIRREKKRSGWLYSYYVRGLNESWNSDNLRQDNDYLLPGLSLSRRDRKGSLVNPDEGFSQLYRAEYGGEDLGSDIDLFRLTTTFGYITSFGDRHRIVSRAELGAVFISDSDRKNLAPSLSFFAGGNQSIRGFGYQSIGNELTVEDESGQVRKLVVGGDRLLTANLEYQYLFHENWRGSLFVDAGDAFDEGEFDANYAAGFGVHYLTQVGAIRLELANPISKDDPSWRMHFSIGAEF